MRQLYKTELYSQLLSPSEKNTIMNAVANKLNQNIGDIAPEKIETEIMQLSTKARNSYFPLLGEALALYEKRGLIRLFNLGTNASGRSPIPTFMPFTAALGRNRVKQQGEMNTYGNRDQDKVIFMNMYRIGNWSADESTYNGLSPYTDLYSCLESALIAYKITIQGMGDKVFNDKTVREYLTKIYTNLFAQTVIKTKMTFGGQPFQNDAAYFLIARFFLLYVLDSADSDMVDDFAYLVVQNHSSLEALKSFEETSMIDYTSLSKFLKTFGEAFFNEKINLVEFETNWVKSYGEGMVFAIEYAPYLLHYLFAAFHSAMLGGTVRLYNRRDELIKMGLSKLYAAVISALR